MSGPAARKTVESIPLWDGTQAYYGTVEALLVSQTNKRLGSKYVSGGNFLVKRCERSVTPCTIEIGASRFVNRPKGLRGDVAPVGIGKTFESANPLSLTAAYLDINSSKLDSLVPYGASGWKKAAPGRPTASVANAAIELFREGLPSIPGRLFRRLTTARSAGSEYLNVQFGWKPLLSDIRKMYETYRNIDKQLNQLVKDNGRGIRRRRSLGKETSTIVTQGPRLQCYANLTGFVPPLGNTNAASYGQTDTIRHVHTERWFAGKFRYYIPDIGSDQWTKRATRALYGLNPTPDVLWNALPWSWLADWFANVGDVVSNMSDHAAENLTAEYAYVMEHSLSQTTVSARGYSAPFTDLLSQQYKNGSYECSYSDKLETKARIGASPFGFGLTFDGFSLYQSSILAALGISRR